MKNMAYRLSAATDCLVLIALLFFTISCKDNKAKEVFEKPAIERIQQGINSLREKLKSHASGWKLTYQPDRAKTGYYQFVFRFVNDTEVEIASDFSGEDVALRRAEYSILTGSAVKLSFATGSAIHKLSDSDFSPIPGSGGAGLKGDFEFLYYGENEQGDLVFNTNRTNQTILFKKAAGNSVDEIKASYDNWKNFITGRTKTVFRCLQETKNGEVTRSAFEFPYHYHARVAKIRAHLTDGAEEYLDEGYLTGFGYRATGLFLDSVKRNNGGFVKNILFIYNNNDGRFVANLRDGTELAIIETRAPLVTNAQKYFLDPTITQALLFFPNDDIGPWLNTPGFNSIFEKLLPTGIRAIILGSQLPIDGKKYDLAIFPGTAGVDKKSEVVQLLTYENKGDRLVIKRNGFLSDVTSIHPDNATRYNEFMDFLTDPQGFYVEYLGRVSKYPNNIFTFTSVRDPGIRFAFYHF